MYNYENYQSVKRQIEERRQNAIAQADMRNEEVRSLSEDIRIIDDELRKTGLILFKTACEGGDIQPLREKNLSLNKTRRDILRSIGFPEDYTDVKYTCMKCSDTGFCDTNMCSCFKEMLIKENIRSSGIGNLIEKQSFENFKLSYYDYDPQIREKMEKNFESAKKFADNFGIGKAKNLLLIGPTGTGKTHISTAIAKTVIERGFEVIYDSALNIVSAFEDDRFKSGYGPYEPKGTKYIECELLIIDDLGTEFVSTFSISCLYNLLNSRQNKGLSTVISTNLASKQIAETYDDRIYSRLLGSGSQILLFAGKDRRLEKKVK